MRLEEKLRLLRKQNGYSQEKLADKLGITRQTVSKWENGQAIPELTGLIALSVLYGVTIDRIVKADDVCNAALNQKEDAGLRFIQKEIIMIIVRRRVRLHGIRDTRRSFIWVKGFMSAAFTAGK